MTAPKTALITGGTRGIGLGIAQALARDGFALAVNGMRAEEEVREVLHELRGMTDVIYCRADISDSCDREKMLAEVLQKFGALQLLVNNAGIAPRERLDLLDATEESFQQVMKTNLQGPYFLTQAAAKIMIKQGAGCIVNISSISAETASVNRGEYCLSKAGVGMATKLWAARLGEFNIPVYEIRPGLIQTDMTAGVKEKYDKLLAGGLCCQQRWGLPEDVGKAVAMLARGDLPYSTGQVLYVDGGLSLPRL